jgi:NADH-quinone oxidoreductase subunit I
VTSLQDPSDPTLAQSPAATAASTPAATPAATPPPPDRARSSIGLLEENCTVCMLCVRECPDWCITIEAHKEERTPPTGGRPRQTNQLDAFTIDFGLCLYCGICVDVCPFDALFWAPAIEPAATSRAGLVHGRDLLRATLAAVPPPPPHDPHGETPKEVTAAAAQP